MIQRRPNNVCSRPNPSVTASRHYELGTMYRYHSAIDDAPLLYVSVPHALLWIWALTQSTCGSMCSVLRRHLVWNFNATTLIMVGCPPSVVAIHSQAFGIYHRIDKRRNTLGGRMQYILSRQSSVPPDEFVSLYSVTSHRSAHNAVSQDDFTLISLIIRCGPANQSAAYHFGMKIIALWASN